MVQCTPSCVLCHCLCSPHPWPSLPARTPQVWVQVPNLIPMTKSVPALQVQTRHGYRYGSVSGTRGYTHGIPYIHANSVMASADAGAIEWAMDCMKGFQGFLVSPMSNLLPLWPAFCHRLYHSYCKATTNFTNYDTSLIL